MIKRPPTSLMVAVLCTLVLLGCASVIPGHGIPPKLFSLSPKSTYSAGLPTVNWQLVVEWPFTDETLDTPRIALSRDRYTLEYFGNARWSEHTPMMIQTLLAESFENTDKIVAVARQATDLRADYVLKTDLREFQAVLSDGGLPTVQVRINAKLVKMPERTIIASFKAERAVEAEGTDLLQMLHAFDTARGKVLKQVVGWTLKAPSD